MDVKDAVSSLFNSQKLCVLSTVNKEGKPQAALVGFAHNHKFELIFGTDEKSRKAKNLINNHNIALVVNGEADCVQYEGIVKLLSGGEKKRFLEILFTKNPNIEKFSLLPGQLYYKIVPVWIRYIDHNFSPGKISELNFE